ncbi:unnamed protein product [Prunus armeniaca]
MYIFYSDVVYESVMGYCSAQCLGVFRGCLRLCYLDVDTNTLFVWELKGEKEDHCDVLVVDGAAKLCFKHKKTIYPLDQMFWDHDGLVLELLAFDPNNENCLYLNIGGDIISCNIITRKWSKVASLESGINVNSYFYPFVLPWWPTPVPRLPQPIA